MATVYSLVCFGGLSGKTVTFTDAGDVVNLTNHGLRQGVTGIVFSTTGSLPTGITAGTTYYPRDGADANKFTIYPTKADALAGTNQVTFSGTGSGTHTVKSAYMLGLSAVQLARYGSSGSERIYDGCYAWNQARSSIDFSSNEVCEVGECFDEYTQYSLGIMHLNASMAITSMVNGEWSSAYHGGAVGGGYRFISSAGNQHIFNASTYKCSFVGIEICRNTSTNSTTNYILSMLGTTGVLSYADKCIINNIGSGTCLGACVGYAQSLSNSIILSSNGEIITGLLVGQSAGAVYNNFVTKCTSGMVGSSSIGQGLVFNNVSVGNTTNYGLRPGLVPNRCLRNVSEADDLLTFTASVGSSTLTFAVGHNALTATYCGITFSTTGTLPSVGGIPLIPGKFYWIAARSSATAITIKDGYSGSALTFDSVGTGTHYANAVWVTEDDPLMIDFSNPDSVFVDWSNNDFRLTANSPLIDAGADLVDLLGVEPIDILNAVRPNYDAATYPNNYWDVGPFEYDHGDGLVPIAATLTISANVSLLGAEVRIYDGDNTPSGTFGTELSGTESNTLSNYVYSDARLLNNTIYIQVMKSGYEEFLTQHTVTNVSESLTIALKADINA